MTSLSDALFVVTDIETTGLSPERDRITEVASVLVQDGAVVDERQTLVNPERFIPQMIQEMTGITNATVLGAPKGAEAFPVVREWFAEGSAFVAHNVSFDYGFLQSSFRRHDLAPLILPKLCTCRLGRRLLPAGRKMSLGHLAAYFGVRINNRHTALGDAHATAQVLIRLVEMLQEEHGAETLEQVLGFQYRTMSAFKEPPKHVAALAPVLATIPSVPGVYRMLDHRGNVIYVGKAKSLRERVASYFHLGAAHPKKITEMVGRVRSIEVEETGSELAALLLENSLIKEHQPRYNTLQKKVRRFSFVRLDRQDPYPRLTLATQIEPDGAEYYGPFSGRRAAELVIETADQLFGLRLCADPLRPSLDVVPCFYHQIHRCGAPCALVQSAEEYGVEVERVREFLSNTEAGIISILERRMHSLAEELQFEEAAQLRNRSAELRRIFTGRQRIADSVNSNNVVILLPAPEEGKRELFMIRYGRLAEQVIVGRRAPIQRIRKLVERVYFDGAVTPPRYSREEVDGIMIIASYLHRYREHGQFVDIAEGESIESVVERVAGML